MPTIKTAISIEETLFHKVEALSKKYHISKSQFFAQAVDFLIRKDEGIELIKQINNSLNKVNQIDSREIANYKKLYKKSLPEQW